MAWTYYTAALDGSRPITQAERDELYTQLDAKLTGACSAAGYSLNSADQTAITGSRLITDRASLDGPGPANTRDNLHAVIAAASAAFANYSAAVTTALSGEGITATVRDAIIASRLDSYRLWNYYWRLIDALNCTNPVTITCRTRSASKTKCGWAEYVPSTPPKRYLTKSNSGAVSLDDGAGGITTNTYSGSSTYSRPACGVTDTLQMVATYPESQSFTYTGFTPATFYASCGRDTGQVLFPDTGSCAGVWDNKTQTSTGVSYDWNVGGGFSGSVSEALSSEYTTALLSGDVDTALAAASWGSYGGCLDAVYTLTSDEMTATKRAVDTKMAFAAVASGYKLTFEVWNRTSGTLVSSHCVALSAGATEHVHSLNPPSTAGAAYYVTAAAVAAGAC